MPPYDGYPFMTYRVLADILFLIHFAFIAYVVLGGFVSRRWPRTTSRQSRLIVELGLVGDACDASKT